MIWYLFVQIFNWFYFPCHNHSQSLNDASANSLTNQSTVRLTVVNNSQISKTAL